jgi:hypothetical protein
MAQEYDNYLGVGSELVRTCQATSLSVLSSMIASKACGRIEDCACLTRNIVLQSG